MLFDLGAGRGEVVEHGSKHFARNGRRALVKELHKGALRGVQCNLNALLWRNVEQIGRVRDIRVQGVVSG